MEEINEEQPILDDIGSSTETLVEGEENSQCEAEKSVSLGKFKNVQALVDAYDNLQKEFTKKCQLLSEFEKDKICSERENEADLNSKFNKFLDENSVAKNYIDEIKSKVEESAELKKESDPYGHAFAEMVFESIKKPKNVENKIFEELILKDDEIKQLIMENYIAELNTNNTPKIISSLSGERVPQQQTCGTPATLKDAKKMVEDMFS